MNPRSPHNDHDLLIQIDERTKNIIHDVADLKTALEEQYVRRDEFTPIKNLVYGLVSLILVSVVGAMVSFLLK